VIDKSNTAHNKNAKTVRDRNTAADIAEAAADGDVRDDDDEEDNAEGESEDDTDGEGEGGQR
jgi:cobalamin biosynthesis protein CobT